MSVQANETIFRLRSLHGVYERALMNAADAIVERRKSVTSRSVFEALLRRASEELTDAGVFNGRWSLFSAEELLAVRVQLDLSGGSVELDEMAAEIEGELIRRHVGFPVSADESSTVASDG